MKRIACAGLLVLLAFGCDDASGGDAGVDASLDAGPALPDAGPIVCDFPAPMVAGTTETDALADAPARCGAASHAWLRVPELGDVISVGSADRFTPAILSALAEGAGATLPRAPTETAIVRTIRYQTQDRGALVEATALVALPERTDGPLDVLLFTHGTSGFTAGCGVSEDSGGRLLGALFASYGYLVVAPDYLGLESGDATYGELHPYLVGEATAIASIDAVRAAGKLAPSDRGGACVSPRVVSFGGSQGGHAALWLDRLMPYYGRELTHLGVVATVPPADLLGQVERALLAPVDATANTAAFYSTAPFWYGYGDRLDEVFASPYDVDLPAALRTACSPGGLPSTLPELFTSTVLDAASAGTFGDLDPWGCILAENGITTTSVPRLGGEGDGYGIFFVTGGADPLVNTPIERGSFQTLCEAGVPMTYLECEGAGHGETTFYALSEILAFIDARFAEEAFVAPTTCVPPAATRCSGTP